jgi:hypothetical protein
MPRGVRSATRTAVLNLMTYPYYNAGRVLLDFTVRAQTARTTEAEVIREVALTTVRMDG